MGREVGEGGSIDRVTVLKGTFTPNPKSTLRAHINSWDIMHGLDTVISIEKDRGILAYTRAHFSAHAFSTLTFITVRIRQSHQLPFVARTDHITRTPTHLPSPQLVAIRTELDRHEIETAIASPLPISARLPREHHCAVVSNRSLVQTVRVRCSPLCCSWQRNPRRGGGEEGDAYWSTENTSRISYSLLMPHADYLRRR